MELPLATLERIMRNAGADKLTEESVRILNEEIEELADELSRDAIEICRENGRSELTAEDVEKASES